MNRFRDLPIGTKVTFHLRPLQDLRHPRDAFRFRRMMETRKAPAKELHPFPAGPLEPEIVPATEVPRDLYEDDHYSEIADDWRAERREWERDEYGSGPF